MLSLASSLFTSSLSLDFLALFLSQSLFKYEQNPIFMARVRGLDGLLRAEWKSGGLKHDFVQRLRFKDDV